MMISSSALERNDLFVLEENGRIIGSAIINQIQCDFYANAPWKYEVPDDQVSLCGLTEKMVMKDADS